MPQLHSSQTVAANTRAHRPQSNPPSQDRTNVSTKHVFRVGGAKYVLPLQRSKMRAIGGPSLTRSTIRSNATWEALTIRETLHVFDVDERAKSAYSQLRDARGSMKMAGLTASMATSMRTIISSEMDGRWSQVLLLPLFITPRWERQLLPDPLRHTLTILQFPLPLLP